MEDPRWLRLVTIGLVLAAVAVGYFLFTGKMSSTSAPKVTNQTSSPSPNASVGILGQNNQVTSIPTPGTVNPSVRPSASPQSAYNSIAERNNQNAQNLPNTGFSSVSTALIIILVLASGWSLRKYTN